MNDFFTFPLISEKEQQGIYGAYGGSNSDNGYDLGEVVVTPDPGYGGGNDHWGDNPWGFGDEPDYGGGSGGGMPDDFYDDLNGEWILVDGVPTFEIALEGGEVIKAKADVDAKDAIGLMLSSMGTAFDSADVAAVIAGLDDIKAIKIGGTAFGVLGTALGAPDYIEKLIDGSAEWDDHVKMGMSVGLLIPGLNGGIVLAGGVFLAAWEIHDLMNK